MKIIREHVIVRVPSVFIEETKYKGVNGKDIILNVLFNPMQHVRNYGIVTSVPDELFKFPLFNDYNSAPGYHDYPKYTWKTTQDIALEIQEGDKVYFHQNSLMPDQQGGKMWNKMFLFSKKEADGKIWHYFRVKYDLIFAAVRYEPMNNTIPAFDWTMEDKLVPFKEDIYFYSTTSPTFDNYYRKKVVMIGSYVFIEPDMETWDDISIPIPVIVNGKKVLDSMGQVMMKPKEEWLVTKKEPEEHYLCGWVRHVGSPLTGDQQAVRPGEYVYFQRYANTKCRFEGADYFRMRQRHIIARSHKN